MNHAAGSRTSLSGIGAEPGFPVGDGDDSVRGVDRPESAARSRPPFLPVLRGRFTCDRVAGSEANKVARADHDTRVRGVFDADLAGPLRAIVRTRCPAASPVERWPAARALRREGTGMPARAFAP